MSASARTGYFPLSTVFKRSIICTAIICAMGAANAQEVDEEQTNKEKLEEIEVIEVSGIFASTAKNLNIKRFSNAIVDAITAEDIGKFPDKNVADSLQRVPGIIIQRDGGEGSTVSIRGLSSDLTFSQLNGNFISSSPGEPSRSFDYGLLPSAMVDKVEVYKSPEARLDEGGVGGTILMSSRKPLSMEANSGVAQVEATYADVTDKTEPQFTGLYSWKNDEEDFGFLVGYTQQTRTNRTLSSSVYNWRWTGTERNDLSTDSISYYGTDTNGNSVANTQTNAPLIDANGNTLAPGFVPQVVTSQVLEQKRERQGFQFTTQWRPTENIELGMNYFRFELGLDSTTSAVKYPEWSYTSSLITDVTRDASGTVFTGVDFTAGADGNQNYTGFPWITGKYTEEESTSDTYDFFGSYEGDEFVLTVKLGHTESEGGPVVDYDTAFYNDGAAHYYGWGINNNAMNVYMDPEMLTNLRSGTGGSFDPGSSNSSFITSTLEEDYIQADLEFDVDWGFIHNLRTGVKYRDAMLHRETRNTFYLSPDFDIEAGEASPGGITRSDSYQWSGGEPELAGMLHENSVGNFPKGVNTNLFPAMNWDKYHNYLTSNFKRYDRIEPEYVYDIQEQITAAYIQADFEEGDYRGNFGLRYVETKTTGSSNDRIQYFYDYYFPDTEDQIPVEDREVNIDKVITQVSTNTQVLPSFNISYDISEELVLRGAVAKVMARPDYSDLGGQERLYWISNERASDRSEVNEEAGWAGGGGNKNLKPFLAWQSDISLEYYYGEGSALGVNVFYKDIDNFVVPLNVTATRDVPLIEFPTVGESAGGENVVIENYSTSANGTNAVSQGVEVFIQHHFENGFGITGNYTINDTNKADVSVDGAKMGESKLLGSSDFQFNSSAFFENADFSARISYTLRGKTSLGLQNGMQTYLDEYQQVDANASYNLMENLVFTASVINLTEEEQFSYIGDDTKDRYLSNSYSGRRFYAGISYKF